MGEVGVWDSLERSSSTLTSAQYFYDADAIREPLAANTFTTFRHNRIQPRAGMILSAA